METTDAFFVGVDVGTRSVRAMLISDKGNVVVDSFTCSISVNNPQQDFYQQSSDEIWKAVCKTVRKVTEELDASQVQGLGFDATCSLVVLGKDHLPLPIDGNEESKGDLNNIIMWMDHRAKQETNFINSTKHEVLKYVGGKMSLEMQIPKLLWLKKNAPDVWKNAGLFLDLPDFLTFKATGKLSRSLCSLVCKWTYINKVDVKGWNEQFFNVIGLQDLVEENFAKIGTDVLAPGDYVGRLTEDAASDLGLNLETAVGASLIDAHAGGLALVASGIQDGQSVTGRLGLICGTSTCHMVVSEEPLFTPGVWGPYLSAMVPNLWLNEGGQSAVGSLIDHMIFNHPAIKFCPEGKNVYGWLEEILANLVKGQTDEKAPKDVSFMTKDIHVYPDFHGNRSPLADSTMTGMVSGLTLESGKERLAILYLATIQSVTYGTKDIIHQLQTYGHHINTVLICGGLTKSKLFVQTTADILNLPVCIPHVKESVLLGAAILGASASKHFGTKLSLAEVAQKLAGKVDTFLPSTEVQKFHEQKFKIFKQMQQDQIKYKSIMESTI